MNGLVIALVVTTAFLTAGDVLRVDDGQVVAVALGRGVSRPAATAPLEVVTIPYVEKVVVERMERSAPEFVREVIFSPKDYNADPQAYTVELLQRYPKVKFRVQEGLMHLKFEGLPQGTYRVLAKRRGGLERVKYNVKVPRSTPVVLLLEPLTGP